MSMDNFYTSTVYEKGAEVIRMYETLVGIDGFRKGMDLYFERHDGCAVTCEDFLTAMADANNADLRQFALWYQTPGTPTVTYVASYNNDSSVFALTLAQKSKSEKPLHIPISFGLLDKATGKEVLPTTVLELKESEQTFEFPNLPGEVVPSLLRNFSAPIRLKPSDAEPDEALLAFLAAHDTDNFNRWEAGQKLYSALILRIMERKPTQDTMDRVCQVFGQLLDNQDASIDYGMQAYALVLPLEAAIAEELDVVDFISIHKARMTAKQLLARRFQSRLLSKYKELTQLMEDRSGQEFRVDAISIGLRHLRNVIFQYLSVIRETAVEQKTAAELAMLHMGAATGMSDKNAALLALASMDGEGATARDKAIKQFYEEAEGYNLVVDKWFTAQALADLPDVLDRVKKLSLHPDFSMKRPNRAKALIDSFTMTYKAFHDESGKGYQFVGEMLARLDRINPKCSSGIAARRFIQWKRYDEKRGKLLKGELEKLKHLKPKVSVDLTEIITKALK